MLIGRDRELAILCELIASPASRARLVVRGERGLGKSALLRTFAAEAARQGWRVLRVAGDPADQEFGMARRILSRIEEDRHVGAVPEPPDAAVQVKASTLPLTLAHAGESVLAFLRTPTLLTIDDVHLADGESLKWLTRLLRRVSTQPLAVVAALTPQAATAYGGLEIGDLLPCLEHQLTLAPFGAHEVGALAEHLLGGQAEEAFVQACEEATAGIPSALYEVLSQIGARGAAPDAATAGQILRYVPRDLGRSVMADIRSGGDEVVSTAVAAAVLCANPSPDLLAHATGLSVTTVDDAIHTLTQAGIVHDTAQGPRFAAPVIAAAVANEVPPSLQRHLHSRAARFLLDAGASWNKLTPHLLQCRRGDEWVVEALLWAADEARRHDNDSAVACLRRVLHEPIPDDVRASVLVLLGEAELSRCARTGARSLRSGLQLDLPARVQGPAARSLAGALFTLNRYPEGIQVLEETVDKLRTADPAQALRTEIDLLYAQVTYVPSASAFMPRLVQLSPDDVEDVGAQRSLAALLAMRSVMTARGPQEAIAHAQRALAQGVIPEGDESFVYTGAVLALAAAGRPDLALTHVDHSHERLRSDSPGLAQAYVHTLRAGVHYRLGNVVPCIGDAQAAVRTLRTLGAGPQANHSVAMWADALLKQGEPQQASALLREHGLTEQLSQHWANDFTLLVRGRVNRALGRPRQALADFLDSGELACARGLGAPAVLPWRSEAALTHALLGETRQARVLIDEELDLARSWGVPETIAVALRAAAVIAGGTEGIRLLGEAVTLSEATSCRLVYAEALAEQGALLAGQGAHGEARDHLQQALKVAQRCGATSICRRAEQELGRIGYRPAGQERQGPQGLTKAEQRVARLAAQGLTNRAIARELFVELRTVELHLSRCYRKLGITGRSGLAEALGEHS
ncbi:AAA family ATPase [Streptomyces sp. NPDC020801]|uniref:AAA family ATPase n=1 Tax=unclassified Streptomyces TaxID=2593676 RepID=UPI0037B7600F